jgi:hypothetical protein
VTSKGWTTSVDELVQIALLDWVAATPPGTVPLLGEFLDAHEQLDDPQLEAAVTILLDQGLVEVDQGYGGIRARGIALTGPGTGVVQARADRRRDPAARAVAAREALLDWLYAQKRAGVASPSPTNVMQDLRGRFEGDPFTEQEIDDASEFLLAKKLISSTGQGWGTGVLRGDITAIGEEVVEEHEASLRQWSSAQRGGSTNFTTHFHGDIHGQVGVGEQVNQTQSQAGIHPDILRAFLDDIREAGSGLEPVDQTYLFTYVDLVQAEGSNPQPDRAMLSGSMDRIKSIAGKVGNASLTASVAALVKYLTTLL